MSISVNFKNIQRELDRVRDELQDSAEVEVREQSEEILNAVRALTPVDTGRARDGWYLAYVRDEFTGEEVMASIRNDVPYIAELNDGSSRQAPRRFVEQTALRFADSISGPIIDRR